MDSSFASFNLRDDVLSMASDSMNAIRETFSHIDEIKEYNQLRVLDAFRKTKFAEAHLGQTTGYGYDDIGREKIEELVAMVFGAEAAYVRIQISSGTQAIASSLFALLGPGDELLAAGGRPYDTLMTAIGINKPESEGFRGTLRDYGVTYREVDLQPDGTPDIDAIVGAITEKTKVVFLQKSRGYTDRRSLRADDVALVAAAVKKVSSDIILFVDNCYGEFVETREPCEVGADLCAGSLIKNIGGGLCPSGGYIAGRKDLVERVAERISAPGLGSHVGPTLGFNRTIAQGVFMAPHTVAEALKGAVFAASMLEKIGGKCAPSFDDLRGDIVQSIAFPSAEKMINFCKMIQAASPIDSYVSPEPWAMPGYDDDVVMAAGTFVQGASIELSADGPVKPPYIAYMQGGLVFEQVKLAIMLAVNTMLEE